MTSAVTRDSTRASTASSAPSALVIGNSSASSGSGSKEPTKVESGNESEVIGDLSNSNDEALLPAVIEKP